MDYPEELLYSQEHEWVGVNGNRARVGITDFAQDALGDVVYIEMPELGATVSANASCAEDESTKAVSDVYSPVSGTVSAINDELAAAPERLNQDPYEEGWIYEVEMSDPSELDGLMDSSGYKAFAEGGS